jgi:serine/threonine protein kinase
MIIIIGGGITTSSNSFLRVLVLVLLLLYSSHQPLVDSFSRHIVPTPFQSTVRRSAVVFPWPWADNNSDPTSSAPASTAAATDEATPSAGEEKNRKTKDRRPNHKNRRIHIGRNIGSGSYGTVHLCTFLDTSDGTNATIMIAKRAWTEEELAAAGAPNTINNVKERAKRCLHYLQVERDCYERMMMTPHSKDSSSTNSTHHHSSPIPTYIGTFLDHTNNYEWIVLNFIGRCNPVQQPAINLADAIYTDWIQQHKVNSASQNHHLAVLQRELGLLTLSTTEDDVAFSFQHTLDTLFISLFTAISYIHQHNIVHCDIKPANILLDPSTSSLVVLDFGSSVLLGKKPSLLSWMDEEQQIIAISPMYAAPEGTFVRSSKNKAPFAFDVYSAGLIFCQLLFNLLDDRTDAAFHQQLRETNHDLDLWLSSKALASKVRPLGLEAGLTYLADRPGLWNILRGTLRADPEQRYTAAEALRTFHRIIKNFDKEKLQETDGPYFQSVISNLVELCSYDDIIEEESIDSDSCSISSMALKSTSRPLHFVATFDRTQSLGLILSEADEEKDDEKENELWKKAISNRRDACTLVGGEVFIRGLVKGGQAETMGDGIFEIGDRLVGVGEIPIYGGGFDKVVKLVCYVANK